MQWGNFPPQNLQQKGQMPIPQHPSLQPPGIVPSQQPALPPMQYSAPQQQFPPGPPQFNQAQQNGQASFSQPLGGPPPIRKLITRNRFNSI
jgi:hypothetical protein